MPTTTPHPPHFPIDQEPMRGSACVACSTLQRPHLGAFEPDPVDDPQGLVAMACAGLDMHPSPGTRIAGLKEMEELSSRTLEIAAMHHAIERGENVAQYIIKGGDFKHIGASFDQPVMRLMRDLRVYLAMRSGELEGCRSLERAEIRVGIRTPGGELKREWM